jgi:hypothetical protein
VIKSGRIRISSTYGRDERLHKILVEKHERKKPLQDTKAYMGGENYDE